MYVEIFINTNLRKSYINKNIYGHFAEHLGRCIDGGFWVGQDSSIPNTNGIRNDVIDALKRIKIPVLRWPGGCFADEYHWKDGIGAPSERKKIVNSNWGGVIEDNSFGTHEFLDLCELLGCEPYIAVNLGSGTIQEAADWVEYVNSDNKSPMADLRRKNGREKPWNVKYFGIGNESQECDGCMRPEYYGDTFRRYQHFMKDYNQNKLFRIACGPCGNDPHWIDGVMKVAHKYMDGLSLHHYTRTTGIRGEESSIDFKEDEYYMALTRAYRIDSYIKRQRAIMDKYDTENKVGIVVDEWGGWYDCLPGTNPGFLYQQNTMRDAMVAALTLNIFNRNSDKVVMANLAQTINVLQALILTEGEKMILTPTYHIFDMFSVHQENSLLDSYIETHMTGDENTKIFDLYESASIDKHGTVYATICNLDAKLPKEIQLELSEQFLYVKDAVLLAGKINDYNTFEAPQNVTPECFTEKIYKTDYGFSFVMPPCSVLRIGISNEK